jgi:antitoxin component YwqK of YwqJK toxin-antitoxin module
MKESIDTNGLYEGKWVSWYDNGQKWEEGKWSKWNENGQIIAQEYYKNEEVIKS